MEKSKNSLSLPKLFEQTHTTLKKDAILSSYTLANILPRSTVISWTTPMSLYKAKPSKESAMHETLPLFKTTAPFDNKPMILTKEEVLNKRKKLVIPPLKSQKDSPRDLDGPKTLLKKSIPATWNLEWLVKDGSEEKGKTTPKGEGATEYRAKKRKFIDRNTAFRNVASFTLVDRFTELDLKITKLNAHAKSELHRIYTKFSH